MTGISLGKPHNHASSFRFLMYGNGAELSSAPLPLPIRSTSSSDTSPLPDRDGIKHLV